MPTSLFCSSCRKFRWAAVLALAGGCIAFGSALTARQPAPDPRQVLDAMKRATVFMVEKVSTDGGYVWSYLPDLSRRWGEMEARPTMIWVQPPGTTTMGHLFLDAYHATGDEYYYRAAAKAGDALIRGQLACGGWNYMIDFAGEASLRSWYDTVGRNGWRLEEFQHYWDNATFDDGGTADATKLLLRLYVEKGDERYKAAFDKALQLVLDSQYAVGAWPQRFPLRNEFSKGGRRDYTSFMTFNDDVTAGNIDLLILSYQALGNPRLLDPIRRGMNSFLVMQLPQPQPGWALQYTPDLKPAGARTYEPAALATHTTAQNVEQLIKFYRLTGDARFLARIPEALDWLDRVQLPADVLPLAGGRTHPTFVEIDTNRPLYVHRRGSNVVNGAYTVDHDPRNTVGHYNSFRQVDVASLRARYQDAKAISPRQATAESPLSPHASPRQLPEYFAVAQRAAGATAGQPDDAVARLLAGLNHEGYWPVELGNTSHPYAADGSKRVTPGDFSKTYVGDKTDTSPYPANHLLGISTQAYIRNMSTLIRYLDNAATAAVRESRIKEQRAEVITLWPEGVPGAIANAGPEVLADGRVSNIHQPTLTAYLPKPPGRPGTAVIICPGGGYQRLAIEKEGREVAEWLNSLGITAFVLKYRVKEYSHPAPLRDVLRAIRTVRDNATAWHVDPGRIGVLGFSAGGHLAATAGTLFDAPEGRTGAAIDRVSARPDFMLLVYPVITLEGQYAHAGSRDSLLGSSPSAALLERLSPQLQVTANTPPAFLVHGGTDQSVAPQNSLLFYDALRRAGVAAEIHVYERGAHGIGLARDQGPMSEWTARAADWLAARGLLAPRAVPGQL